MVENEVRINNATIIGKNELNLFFFVKVLNFIISGN